MTAMAHAMLVMWSMLQSTTWHLLLTCFCLDVVTTIVWGLRLPVVLQQSKRLMRPVVYQTRCFCTNVGNATERIIDEKHCSVMQYHISVMVYTKHMTSTELAAHYYALLLWDTMRRTRDTDSKHVRQDPFQFTRQWFHNNHWQKNIVWGPRAGFMLFHKFIIWFLL